MNEGFLQELEGAARVIMAPLNLVTIEERHKAEEILLNFRKTKTPIRACKQILEKSDVDYLHFEAAEVIKRGIIREWNFVSFSDKEDLIQYLFNFVVTKDIACFVRDKILIVISIMVKRMSADDKGKQRRKLLNQVEDLITNADNPKKILGCQLISILMQEYATTSKSSDIGLPWEVHNKCKQQFEITDLIGIFKFVMGLLKDVTGIETPFQPATEKFILCLMRITEQVLVWCFNNYIDILVPIRPFTTRYSFLLSTFTLTTCVRNMSDDFADEKSNLKGLMRVIGQFESTREMEDYPTLYFNIEWKEIFLSPELVPLMFMIYWKVRYSEELSHHALTCLIQLASVTAKGSERNIYKEEARVQYARRYLENFSKLISSVNVSGKEALGISAIARKLCFCYHYEIAHGLSRSEQESFLDEMTTLTCHFCEKSVSEESEDNVYEDSFRNMISVWCSLFGDYGIQSKVDILREYAIRIFSKYVQSRIAPPNGFRSNGTSDEEIDNENLEDLDRVKYLEQLQVVGIFGRYILDYSLPVLYKLLEYGTDQLKFVLQIMEVRPMTLEESMKLESVFEDLHWCLMISGHVLTMESVGEVPCIPSEVVAYSIKRMNLHSNVEATLETLAKSRDLMWVNPKIDQCDDVIRIFSDALRLCVIEDSAASINLSHLMSPLVSCSLMWFIKKFCLYYLVPIEHNYMQPSPILMSAFGKQTEGAIFIINFIISKVQNNIVNFHAEPVLMQDTVDLFGDLLTIKNRAQHFMKPDNILSLIYMQNDLKAGHLPPGVRRSLYRGFALASVSLCQERHIMDQYLLKVFEPLHKRYSNFLAHGKAGIHNEYIQNELIDICECLIGISMGSSLRSAHRIFEHMHQMIGSIVELFKNYYNYQLIVQSILELLSHSARYLVSYLKHDQAQKMYDYCIDVVTSYAKCHANRLTSDTLAEETTSQDLLYMVDILTHLLSKDYLDFCPSDSPEYTVKASTHVMRGFCAIMPFMKPDLLKFPNLCLQYYRLLSHVNEVCQKDMCTLDNGVLVHILQYIELGLSQFGPEITPICLDFISRVCCHMFNLKLAESPMYEMLKPCMKVILELTLSNHFENDLICVVADCVYFLICCYPTEFDVCMKILIANQQDPMVADRLSASFDRMLAGVEFDNDRHSKTKFKVNFEKFVSNVKGFLLVK